MVAGVNGRIGVNAPRAVVEEQKAERDYVTVLTQPMVVIPVMVNPLEQIRVTWMLVS